MTFRYKDYRRNGSARYRTMTLGADEFIRRFLLHVLPKGFHRIRPSSSSPAMPDNYIGTPNARRKLIRWRGGSPYYYTRFSVKGKRINRSLGTDDEGLASAIGVEATAVRKVLTFSHN